MKTITLYKTVDLPPVHEATLELTQFPDVIYFNNVVYVRLGIIDSRAYYREGTVHAL